MELNKQITFSYILNKLKDTGNASSTLISDEFSEEKEYLTGEYCIKDNALYIFTADKSAGEWDESKAEPTSIGSVLSEQNKNLEYIMENLSVLSSEEHKCGATFSAGDIGGNNSVTRTIYFDRVYLEPPAVQASASSPVAELKGKMTVKISNITTTSCVLTIKNTDVPGGYGSRDTTVKWSATGYVKKVS